MIPIHESHHSNIHLSLQSKTYAFDYIMKITKGKINIKGIIFGIHWENLKEIWYEIQWIVLYALKFRNKCEDLKLIIAIWNKSSIATTQSMRLHFHCDYLKQKKNNVMHNVI